MIRRLALPMIKLLDFLFRSIVGSDTTSNQARREVLQELGVSLVSIHRWKPHSIVQINADQNLVVLRSESGNIIPIEADLKTIQNLTQGISENQFLSKYGQDCHNWIASWNFWSSPASPPHFQIELRAKLKVEDQTTEKRKKMYHKRNVTVSKFFIQNLIARTV